MLKSEFKKLITTLNTSFSICFPKLCEKKKNKNKKQKKKKGKRKLYLNFTPTLAILFKNRFMVLHFAIELWTHFLLSCSLKFGPSSITL